jgi:hypothetical protein
MRNLVILPAAVVGGEIDPITLLVPRFKVSRTIWEDYISIPSLLRELAIF